VKVQNVIILSLLGFVFITSFLGLSAEETFVFGITLILLLQGGFATYAMFYSFLNPENTYNVIPPRVVMGGAFNKFTLILPAKEEEKVIGDTIWSMANINYPVDKYEVLVIVRDDDIETKQEVEKAIQQTGRDNIKLIKIDGYPINKSYSLNMAMHYAQGNIIAVFDAEDHPHPDILKSVDEVIYQKEADVVQAGVQLINVGSYWFSPLNCLEYYFWFKSVLPYLSSQGATPLGGNTVFFKKKVLEDLGGWDENCLTEDADIGIRASVKGYKTEMFYLEEMATLEETPVDERAFVRQRTRWDQGYLQILFKGDWMNIDGLKKQALSLYVLVQPIIHQFMFIAMLAIPFISWGLKTRLWIAMFSWIPMYFLILQLGLYFVGLTDLKKNYNLDFPLITYLFLVIYFVPYQFLLAFSFARAAARMVLGIGNWEKTLHLNTHRAKV
jgi:cellulose synthase/poly-beta-1,6-N-acetylglucosamine synthase-like glycosyltransferase